MNVFSNQFENELASLIKNIIKEEIRSIFPPTPPTPPHKYITRQEAAKTLRVCINTLNNYVKRGKLQTYRVEGRVLLKRDEVDAFVQAVNYRAA